jgi:hypothetical protein
MPQAEVWPNDARPQIDGWSADKCGAQRHDLEIVVQMLPLAAALRRRVEVLRSKPNVFRATTDTSQGREGGASIQQSRCRSVIFCWRQTESRRKPKRYSPRPANVIENGFVPPEPFILAQWQDRGIRFGCSRSLRQSFPSFRSGLSAQCYDFRLILLHRLSLKFIPQSRFPVRQE